MVSSVGMITLPDKIRNFPKTFGVYLMKDRHGEVLYIGKAKDLRSRVSSYFKTPSPPVGEGQGEGKKERYQIAFLMRRVADIDFVVTDSEKEALLLENTLIKKHKPRYNIFFKDDKSYVSLKLNIGHPFPGLYVTRDIKKDGSLYFGPYASAGALRQTVDLLTKHFQLRTCSDHEFANRSRPCLEYHIGRCTAPCVGKVAAKNYQSQVEETHLFLEGRRKELLQKLKMKMKMESDQMHYEEAAKIRDLIATVHETLEKQKVVRHGGKDFDAVGFYASSEKIAFCVLLVRKGILLDRKKFVFFTPFSSCDELITAFLLQYYGTVLDIPPTIYIPNPLQEREAFSLIPANIVSPQKGEKAKMVALAEHNAEEWLEAQKEPENEETLLQRLGEKLSLMQPPHWIECVDISNLQGEEAVGSLVCFSGKKPLKNRYRKFKIRLTEGPNDYAMMVEVLSRRFKRALIAASEEEKQKWSLPDLLLVDGGKGQLQIALRVLADLGLHSLPVVAIAKAKEGEEADKIFIPGRKNPLSFRSDSPELLYLMRIRDEAHRFAITYHRRLRAFRALATW